MPDLLRNVSPVCYLVLWVFGLALSSSSLQAYIEPGSASILMQLIFGSLAGVLFLLRLYAKKIKALYIKFKTWCRRF